MLLEDAAEEFSALLGIRYKLTLGHKKKSEVVEISFHPEDFHHLAGLHKLKGSYAILDTQNDILSMIRAKEFSTTTIQKDAAFPLISERLEILSHFREFLESKTTSIYAFDPRNAHITTSLPKGLLAKGRIASIPVAFSLFVRDTGEYTACSVFAMNKGYDYAIRQTKFAILMREKLIQDKNNSWASTILYRHPAYREDFST